MRTSQVARLIQIVVLLFVGSVLLSQYLIYAPGARPQVHVLAVWSQASNGSWESKLTVSSTFSGDFSSVALERNRSVRSDIVYFYFDPVYPISYSDVPDWYGLSQHLAAVAGGRGMAIDVRVVNTQQLLGLLGDPSTESSTVVMASGVLPSPIFSSSVDHLDPWIRGGGLLVWVGDQIGAYSGLPGQGLSCGSNDTLGVAGTARIFNVSWQVNEASTCSGRLQFPETELFLNATGLGASLGVNYPYGLPGDAFLVQKVDAGGGLALGGVLQNSTDVAFIPRGMGGLLDFAGPATDPIRLSYSIDNLLQSGFLAPGTMLVGSQSFTLAAGGSETITQWWGPSLPASGQQACEFTVQTDYLAPFGSLSCDG